jgi:hypothetical protein
MAARGLRGIRPRSFDVDRVARRFYDRFQAERTAFLKFLKGIAVAGDAAWYASLMLNRLMFIYFIQKKGFLDGDPTYLRNRLRRVQAMKGKDSFLTFYRHFLLRLFHEGLGQHPDQRKKNLDELLGQVPYLDGGLFDVHDLERTYPDIQIADAAFEQLFDFFDEWRWHLDERRLRDDREINPDVLGYIFERYINQKQMGAYYTKEDITGYIARNTILPFLFNAAKKQCVAAFQPGGALWRLLRDDPDRYIHASVRKGADLLLPSAVEEGLADVSHRRSWNMPAAPEYALPTETWREHVVRRRRCHELRDKLKVGDIYDINDLITHNLDICLFAEDAIANCEGPELLRAFYQALEKITVLDPTCGSGAFLFAALNILEPLYEACLDRMQGFVEDMERLGGARRPEQFADFRKVLDEAARHPNRRYFILKSILVNNLYGVDIMEEAVEICKIRLFLKLIAQVESPWQIEPLPDIDFNVRAGNTLVGFVSREELVGLRKDRIPFDAAEVKAILDQAKKVEKGFAVLRRLQVQFGATALDYSEAKKGLQTKLANLRSELDRYLAGEYGVDLDESKEFHKWRDSHRPFHWLAEFYGIMSEGGFDVIIGNPPYLERRKLGGLYTVKGLQTGTCRDIYAWVVERTLSFRASEGKLGLIVPVSLTSSGSFNVLREILAQYTSLLWLSHFANRPGQLFSGAQNRLTIFLSAYDATRKESFSTRYHRWDAKRGERDALFEALCYASVTAPGREFHGLYPKAGRPEAVAVVRKMLTPRMLGEFLRKQSEHPVYWVRVPGYFCQFFLEPPMARPEKGGPHRIRGEVNAVFLSDPELQRIVHAVLNSSTYYQFYCNYSDGRHINPSDVTDFPFELDNLSPSCRESLVKLSKHLEVKMRENISYWRKSGLLIESVDSRSVKTVLDEIDTVLARHFGFSDEELDFILNYDIKYRMR